MRKYTLLVFIFWIVQINAQVNSDLKPYINNIPTSPEVALLGRFGEIPVGYYTGTAEFSIPLYTINMENINVPITLRYHSSGIKVEDEATWVGLGWDLSPGGEIIQEIKGKEDLHDTNLHQQMYPQDYEIFKNNIGPLNSTSYSSAPQTGLGTMMDCMLTGGVGGIGINDDSAIIIDDLLHGEGQPDIYHYRFGEYSGKFFIHPETKEIVLIDKKQTIIFEHANTLTNEGWVAKTLDGNEYYFQAYESATGINFDDFKGKTFRLSSIELKSGNTIFFEYIDETYTQRKEVQNVIINGNVWNNENSTEGGIGIIYTQNNKKTLSKIISSDTEIIFNHGEREDINLSPIDKLKRLNSIDIISRKTGKKVKTYLFNYSYFPYNLTGVPLNVSGLPLDSFVANHLDSFGKRLKLDTVKEIGYNGDEEDFSKPSYTFEYDTSVTMPLKNSFAKDFFGYYNGKNNQSLLPDLDYFDYQHLQGVYYSEFSPPFSYHYTKNNRFTDNNYSGAYLLNKIFYPTGGHSEMVYEPNTFNNQFIPDNAKMQIARKLYTIEDKNQSEDITQKIFQISKSTTVKFQNSIYDGYIPSNANIIPYTQQQLAGAYIQFLRVNMTGGSPQVTIIKTWNVGMIDAQTFNAYHGAAWDEEIRLEYDPNPNIYYTVNVSLPGNIQNNSYNSVSVRSRISYIDDNGVDTSISSMCGLRIKKIINYIDSNEISDIKVYNYFGGKLLNKFSPLLVTEVNYTRCVNDFIYPTTLCHYAKRIILNSDDFISNEGNPIGYDNVEEIRYDKTFTQTIGSNKYYFYNSQNQNSKGFPTILDQQNGFLQKEMIFDKNNVLKRENTYGQSNIIDTWTSYLGLTIISNIMGDTDFIPNSCSCGGNVFNYKYTYYGYSIISNQYLPSGKTTKEYLNGNIITNSESYTYNSDGFIKTKTTTNSQGETILETYKYASDFSPYMIYGALMNYNMQGIPLETEVYKNNNLITKKVINYDVFNNGILLPKSVSNFKEGNWLSSKIKLLSYNSKGLLKEFSNEDSGYITSIIYGYNETQPIAKIENASYSSINPNLITAIQNATDSPTITEENLIIALNALRTALPNAMVTTFTYKPLVGVSTITDPKGMTTYYKYDSFGRLKTVKDADGNILSENQYHYRP